MTKPTQPAQPKTASLPLEVDARVLQDCAWGRCDSVAAIPADQLAAAKSAGLVDDHPDAVAYARSLSEPG